MINTVVHRERFPVFHPEFREDLEYLVRTNWSLARRALELVEATLQDPIAGIGKPEPLNALGRDTWSRRLSQEHRVVYLVSMGRVDFLQARYHY